MATFTWISAAWAGIPPGYTPGTIDYITLSSVDVDFAPGGVGSTLALDGHTAPTTIYFSDDPSTPFSPPGGTDFDLDTVLAYDWSNPPQAEGWFENGPFVVAYGGDDLVAGDVSWYWVAEDDNTGVLIGVGLLSVSGGLLVDAGDWGDGVGSTSSILFSLNVNPDDFGQSFSGSAALTLFPDDRAIPEPATLLLLVGGLALVRSRRR
jgi:hypothetical protein